MVEIYFILTPTAWEIARNELALKPDSLEISRNEHVLKPDRLGIFLE